MAPIEFLHVTKRFANGTVAVDDLTLRVEEGEFLILVGPSGCGKTTALRMVAGLEEVSSGAIRIGGQVVNDLAPSERDIAMVFQSYALYPHMTVFDNIGFPLRQRRVPKAEREARVHAVAELLRIGELMRRRPKELSGGQRQRVAIGRALIREPQAFLMDEPLSNLDAKLRIQMRAELISLHQRLKITTIYVTHDQTEAMTLGDRVAVMNAGVIQQVDTPQELYKRPANLFVAGFIGSPPMNFFEGHVVDGKLLIGSYAVDVGAELTRHSRGGEAEVLVGVRPEDLTLAEPDSGQTLSALVKITEQLGPELLVYLRIEDTQVIQLEPPGQEAEGPEELAVARLDPNADIRIGERIPLRINSQRLHLFDRVSGESLLEPARL